MVCVCVCDSEYVEFLSSVFVGFGFERYLGSHTSKKGRTLCGLPDGLPGGLPCSLPGFGLRPPNPRPRHDNLFIGPHK